MSRYHHVSDEEDDRPMVFKRRRSELPPIIESSTSVAAPENDAIRETARAMDPYYLDLDDEDDRPLIFKVRPSELPLTTPSTTVSTLAARVQENDAIEEPDYGEDNDDMERVAEERYQSEGEDEEGLDYGDGEDEEGLDYGDGEDEEGLDYGDGEEGVDYGYGDDGLDYGYGDDGSDYGYGEDGSDYGYGEEENREDSEDRDSQTDEENEEVDDRNQGQARGGGDTVTSDINSRNSPGSLGTKSSMLGAFTDPDVLDCPICCEALTAPVFQCENGHIECSRCCIKIGNKCPSCSLPIGYIRCRSIERILNSVKFSCRNLEYGCKESMLHRKRGVHEKACMFARCYCPLEFCDFVGSAKNLYVHFGGRHSRSAIQFHYECPIKFWLKSKGKGGFLQEKTDGTIFILNCSDNGGPCAINLNCIGVLDPKEEFYYELSVEHEGSTLKLKSVSAVMPKWSASQPLRKYLVVPSDFLHCSGSIKVTVYIEKRRVA